MKKKILMLIIAATLGLTVKTMAQVPSYVPANGLIGYFGFNNNGNDQITSSVPSSNSASSTTDRFGNPNSAYQFGGSNVIKYTNSSHPLFNVGNTYQTFTMNFWVKPTVTGFGSILGAFGWGWFVELNNQNNINLAYVTSSIGTWTNCISSSSLVLNSWQMITITRNGAANQVFINGVLDNTTFGPNFLFYSYYSNWSNCWFGANGQDNNNYFSGDIDDVAIWNRALSQQEITALYNPANAALPINILQFTGKRVEKTNVLKWTTSSEQNNAYFEIEHSKDAQNFTVVSDKINSKANNGNSIISLEYSFTDVLPNEGHNYYRLRQTDIDGKTSMAKNVVDVYFSNVTMVTLYPNPAQSSMNVKADSKLIGKFYTIYDNIGKAVKSGKLNAVNTTIELGNLSNGIYLFSVGENWKQSFKILNE
jgi:hypothetical protein